MSVPLWTLLVACVDGVVGAAALYLVLRLYKRKG